MQHSTSTKKDTRAALDRALDKVERQLVQNDRTLYHALITLLRKGK
jgi:hypothetical protein